MMRVGVIGLGYMGGNHARNYAEMDECQVAAVCDVDRARAEKVAGKYGAKAYTDWKALLASGKLDCVSICVPTTFHKAVMLECASLGIPALVEKPVASTVEEADEMVAAAERARVPFLVGHIERFNPAVARAKKLVSDRALDSIFLMASERVGPNPGRPSDVSVVIDLGVHDIDIMQHLLGQNVVSVYAKTGRVSMKSVDDLCEAFLTFADGTVGHLRTNWLTPTKIRKLKIFGKTGMLDLDYISQDVYFYENKPAPESPDYGKNFFGVGEGEMRKLVIRKEEPLRLELRHFLDCAARKAQPAISVRDGRKALQVACAIRESAAAGKPVEIQPG